MSMREKQMGRAYAWGLTVLVAAALMACSKSEQPAAAASGASAPNPALTVSTVLPQVSTWPVTVTANGSIAAWQEASIGAEVGGLRLERVKVEVGDTVHKGDVMALLRQDSLKSDVALTKATLAEAQAMLAEAHANAARARSLQPTDMISKQDALRAFTAEQTAMARVDSVRAQLAVNELRLAQTQVVAPDDGVVSSRTATVGAVVQAGQELFRIVRRNRLEWRAEVAASDLHRIKAGMTATLAAPGGPALTGKVRTVAPTVDANTRNGLVYVDLDADGVKASGIKPGMFANGQFDIGQAQGLTLPQTAVQLRDGFAYVFLVDQHNQVDMIKVQVGRRMGDRVEIVKGLDAQTPVVAAGVGFLTDGDTVRVVSASASAPQ
ncbi:MAG TPA: efflux RND transporter periplasmic adaptor subunit [Aquabacterium sp.]|nr:efflux RND transporter periplasmic adaptor subunit [Aquabacterium sp.]